MHRAAADHEKDMLDPEIGESIEDMISYAHMNVVSCPAPMVIPVGASATANPIPVGLLASGRFQKVYSG